MIGKHSMLAAHVCGVMIAILGCRPTPALTPPASTAPTTVAQQPPLPPPPPAPPPPPPPRGLRPPPPPRPAGPEVEAQAPLATATGSIRHFNYGPNAEITGLMLSNGMLVNLPPDAGEELRSLVRAGASVNVTGHRREGWAGRTILDATLVTVAGRAITIPAPAGPPPPPPPPPPE